MGGNYNSAGYPHYHFKLNNTWIQLSDLPYDFSYGMATVQDNSIHIMSGSNNNTGNAIVHIDHDIIMKGTYTSY